MRLETSRSFLSAGGGNPDEVCAAPDLSGRYPEEGATECTVSGRPDCFQYFHVNDDGSG